MKQFLILLLFLMPAFLAQAEKSPFPAQCTAEGSSSPFISRSCGIETRQPARFVLDYENPETMACGFESRTDSVDFICIARARNRKISQESILGFSYSTLSQQQQVQYKVTSFGAYTIKGFYAEWVVCKDVRMGQKIALFDLLIQSGNDVIHVLMKCQDVNLEKNLCALKDMMDNLVITEPIAPTSNHQVVNLYYDTGEVYISKEITDGVNNGPYTIYYKNGKVKYRAVFAEGSQTTTAEEYDEKGERLVIKDSIYMTSGHEFKVNEMVRVTFCLSGKHVIAYAWYNAVYIPTHIEGQCVYAGWKAMPMTAILKNTLILGEKLEADICRFYYYDHEVSIIK